VTKSHLTFRKMEYLWLFSTCLKLCMILRVVIFCFTSGSLVSPLRVCNCFISSTFSSSEGTGEARAHSRGWAGPRRQSFSSASPCPKWPVEFMISSGRRVAWPTRSVTAGVGKQHGKHDIILAACGAQFYLCCATACGTRCDDVVAISCERLLELLEKCHPGGGAAPLDLLYGWVLCVSLLLLLLVQDV